MLPLHLQHLQRRSLLPYMQRNRRLRERQFLLSRADVGIAKTHTAAKVGIKLTFLTGHEKAFSIVHKLGIKLTCLTGHEKVVSIVHNPKKKTFKSLILTTYLCLRMNVSAYNAPEQSLFRAHSELLVFCEVQTHSIHILSSPRRQALHKEVKIYHETINIRIFYQK